MNPNRLASHAIVVTVLLAVAARPCASQDIETVMVNGKILTVDSSFSIREALAIRDGKIAAVGRTVDVRKLAGPRTRLIDLQGRTVIPGLIDSHMHAIRAALNFSTEIDWVGTSSLSEALARISDAARARKPGDWLVVGGGWNVNQFTERRRPTLGELEKAAAGNPAYVQLGFGWALMTPAARTTLRIGSEADLPRGARFERNERGELTGAVTGPQEAIVSLFERVPKPALARQVEGTKSFFRTLNRLALTGVVDPGGCPLAHEDYRSLFDVWRQHRLTVRMAYMLCPFTPGSELDEFRQWTELLPAGFGDDYLRFIGLGERVTLAMNNNDNPTETVKSAYYDVLRWAAQRGFAITMHALRDASARPILDVYERVNRETPIAGLRWSIAHINDASVDTLTRMKALGVGWTVQDSLYFGGEQGQGRQSDNVRREPPLVTARKIGVVVGGGTDANRVASYNPFTSLQYFLDGRTVTGRALRGPEETPTREEALQIYTKGSAWFSHDDDKRGSLEVDKLADLAVLSRDYMTVPIGQIGGIESVLTLVNGKVVYASGPFAALSAAPSRGE